MAKKKVQSIVSLDPAEQAKRIDKAKSVIKEYLLANPGKRAGVYFSCGKDSLLTALLAVEVSEELGIDKPALFTSFVPYELEEEKRWNQYLIDNISGVDWYGVEPPPFFHFSVYILGIGTVPPVFPQIKQCNSKLKRGPLQYLIREYKKDFLFLSGIRAEESSRRLARFKSDGYYDKSKKFLTPIVEVDEATLWSYLETNLHKIGIDYAKLRENYATKRRGGCWICPSRKVPDLDNATTLEDAITAKLRSYVSQEDDNKNELLAIYGEYNKALSLSYRSHLSTCRLWYNDLIELQKKFKREILSETDKKIIAEIWNWREKINNRIIQKDFLESVFNGSYKMLYPELFDIVFYKKGNRYCYIPGIIKKVR